MILPIPCLLLFLVGSVAYLILGGAETAALAADRRQHRDGQGAGDPASANVVDLLDELRRLLNATLAGRMLAFLLAVSGLHGLSAAMISGSLAESGWMDLLAAGAVAALLLTILESSVRPFFRAHADTALAHLSLPLHFLAFLLAGPMEASQRMARRSLRAPADMGLPEVNGREELGRLFGAPQATSPVQAASPSDPLDEASRSMIQNIVELEWTRVREVMKPLIDVVAIRLGHMDLEGLKELARQTGYSKFPVFRDRVIHLTGYVSIYDVLRNTDPGKTRIEDFVREAHYVPETMRVNDLLKGLLRLRLMAAVAVDEYGSCSGWVTQEDIIEEIVGEIEDEFDPAGIEPPLVREPDGAYLCEGRIDIDDLNAALQARFLKDGFETLGGWLYDTLGRIPSVGDRAQFEDFTLTVLEMKGPVIRKVRLRRASDDRE